MTYSFSKEAFEISLTPPILSLTLTHKALHQHIVRNVLLNLVHTIHEKIQ